MQGGISVEGLVVRYRADLPPVLHGLWFKVEGGTKVGVAGRTGCGKSTLMMALYRIVEPAAGRVVIDGIDTATIGLRDLRSRLALVPQDPVVFSGTVRSNLDPFDEYAVGRDGGEDRDAPLWEALGASHLDAAVRAMEGGLDAEVRWGVALGWLHGPGLWHPRMHGCAVKRCAAWTPPSRWLPALGMRPTPTDRRGRLQSQPGAASAAGTGTCTAPPLAHHHTGRSDFQR